MTWVTSHRIFVFPTIFFYNLIVKLNKRFDLIEENDAIAIINNDVWKVRRSEDGRDAGGGSPSSQLTWFWFSFIRLKYLKLQKYKRLFENV